MSFEDNYTNMEFPDLYQTINSIYQERTCISRILYLAKIKETGTKDEKITRENIISNFINEIKKKIDNKFNCLILFLGTSYSIVILEVKKYIFKFLIKNSTLELK